MSARIVKEQKSVYSHNVSGIPPGALKGIALKVARLQKDPHRPRYHFLPGAGGALNDAIPFFWKGTYHVFFQHLPPDDWEPWVWGHTCSRDLVHWKELPVALSPGPGWYDKDICASGCLLAHDGKVYIFYTGMRRTSGIPGIDIEQTQCVAIAEDDDLIEWRKDTDNPLMDTHKHLPPSYDSCCWRDPDIWKDEDRWYMILGGCLNDKKTGAIPLYASTDLRKWSYVNCLYQTTGSPLHGDEFPNFFELEGRHVLLHHPWGLLTTMMEVGSYQKGVFQPLRRSIYDSTLGFATKTLLDDQGRRIAFNWVIEDRPAWVGVMPLDSPTRRAGWAGVMSLPRVLHLSDDNSVLMEPAPELKSLRGRHTAVPRFTLKADTQEVKTKSVSYQMLLDAVQGDCLEILVSFHLNTARRFGILVRCAPDFTEKTSIEIDLDKGKLIFDNTHSSLGMGGPPSMPMPAVRLSCYSNNELSKLVYRSVRSVDIGPLEGKDVNLHIFLDRSVVEVFANNNRSCITGRMYPTREDSLHVGVFCKDGTVACEGIDIWEMKGI